VEGRALSAVAHAREAPHGGRDPSELAALREFSAELGRNPLRTQAAGGNTSLKADGWLWIKTSGAWLADAATDDIMVPIRLGAFRAAVRACDPAAESAIDFVEAASNPKALRPSVESAFHAVMPQRVVVHIHCVATIALAVRRDAGQLISERLAGDGVKRFAFFPYIHPGLPLAHAIAALDPIPPVIVLGNHGLIVAGETVVETRQRLDDVVAAFDAPRRAARAADIAALARSAEGAPYRLPRDQRAHDTAMDATSLAIAAKGTLYPDHVVFLGPGIFVPEAGEAPAMVAEKFVRTGAGGPKMLVLPGQGVLIHRDANRGADELARGLAEVTARIPANVEVNTLTASEESKLVNWDAEAWRLAMARTRQGA
jgi:rhamnose utilization protein RhaD (predicted bifunctional aldolase and dehydrogenase)